MGPHALLSPGPRTVPPIRVLVADDEEVIRLALAEVIERADGIELVASAKDADEAIRIASLRRPDVALLDVRMPSGGGPRAAREIRWRSPATRLIALSAHADDRSVDDMLAGGATSYLMKDAPIDDILEAIHRTAEGEAVLSRAVAKHVAGELGTRLEREHQRIEDRLEKETRIRRLLAGGEGLKMVYQPIADVGSGRIVGVEALARFSIEPERTPDLWFAEASEVGLGQELQIAAVRGALSALDELPSDVFLSVNVDPETLASPVLAHTLGGWPGERIVVELTEHVPTSDYRSLLVVLAQMRRSGVRLAVDDAGAGFSSLRHIVQLSPDIVKLDISICRHIDTEETNQALASALVGFTRQTGMVLVAEGVETAGEYMMLADLGVPWVQGHHVGRPRPLTERFDVALPRKRRPGR